jgi:hypothetical protein
MILTISIDSWNSSIEKDDIRIRLSGAFRSSLGMDDWMQNQYKRLEEIDIELISLDGYTDANGSVTRESTAHFKLNDQDASASVEILIKDSKLLYILSQIERYVGNTDAKKTLTLDIFFGEANLYPNEGMLKVSGWDFSTHSNVWPFPAID